MKHLLAMGAIALACTQAWGLGIEIGNTDTTTGSSERSKDISNKVSKAAGSITLLNDGLGAAAPIDRMYIKKVWHYGESLRRQLEDKLGVDPAFYAERRAETLGASDDPAMQHVGLLYAGCKGDEGRIAAVARREVMAQFVQSPSFVQQVIVLETERVGAAPEGYEKLADKDWKNYRTAAVASTYAANFLGKLVTDAVPVNAPLSLAQRRLELVKAFYALPDAALDAAVPASLGGLETSWNLWKKDGPLDFRVDTLGAFRVDPNAGVTLMKNGALVYGQGNTIAGRKIDYTDDASGNVKQTSSHSHAKTVSTKRVQVQ